MNDLYKKEICSNCANDNCTNRIEQTRRLDLVVDQLSTTTIVRCKDFVCKRKRKKQSLNWGSVVYD